MQKKSTINLGNPSKRQAEILHFAREYRRENGYSPALTEMAKHFDISIPTVHQHISALQKKGLLTVEKGKKRSIQSLRDHKSSIVEIPLMGLISAGGPIEAIRDPKPVEVPGAMLPPDEILIEELQTPTYEVDRGKIRVMKKATMREVLKRSPDRADALCLTFAVDDSFFGGITFKEYPND